ncbi:MAG: ABC transporter permease, partial [Micrococcus sp.]|nr:ABC transporter permease [Micrococcus sp.]
PSGRHTAAGLWWRQLGADPWVSLALAALVAVASFFLTAGPRALQEVSARQLSSDVAALSPAQRDISGRWQTTVEPPVAEEAEPDVWAPFIEGAEAYRQAQPEPLRSALGPAELTSRQQAATTFIPPAESGYYRASATVYADPSLADQVDLVRGEWPEPTPIGGAFPPAADGQAAEGEDGPPAEPGAEPGEPQGNGVLILDSSLEELAMEIGDQVTETLFISGTYRPTDPDDPRWQHLDNATSLFLNETTRAQPGQPVAVRMDVWYPVDADALLDQRPDAGLLRQQLTGMVATAPILVERGDPALGPSEGNQQPSLNTGLTATLDQTVRAQRAGASLLAVVAAGPVGVTAAVLALAAGLIIHRRRPTLAMTLARGASPVQLRRLIALEGVLVGVPAAVLGHLLARWLVPDSSTWWEPVLTLVLAATPAVALALSLEDASLLQRRSDLSGRSSSRWRWVGEAAVVLLAALATWRLLDRGARGDTPEGSGIDVLAAASPVLLSLAAAVLALRLYPVPLAALTRMVRGGRGLTPFLGSARALRDPAGGIIPALA